MRSIAQRTAKKAHFTEENVLPMINVVFLLLIFFMIAGHIAASDPMELKEVYSKSETRTDDNQTTIFVDSSGKINFRSNDFTTDTIQPHLKSYLDDNTAAIIRLKVDANYNGQSMLELLSILRDLGMENVTLVTQLPEEG